MGNFTFIKQLCRTTVLRLVRVNRTLSLLITFLVCVLCLQVFFKPREERLIARNRVTNTVNTRLPHLTASLKTDKWRSLLNQRIYLYNAYSDTTLDEQLTKSVKNPDILTQKSFNDCAYIRILAYVHSDFNTSTSLNSIECLVQITDGTWVGLGPPRLQSMWHYRRASDKQVTYWPASITCVVIPSQLVKHVLAVRLSVTGQTPYIRCNEDTGSGDGSSRISDRTSQISECSTAVAVSHTQLSRPQRDTFAICYSPLFGNRPPPASLLENIEMNAQLSGVAAERLRINIYMNASVSADTRRVADYYRVKHRASVIPWDIPAALQHRVHFYGQWLALNDCLYRTRGRATHVANIDYDEVLVPSTGRTWSSLVNELMPGDKESRIGAIAFQVKFYRPKQAVSALPQSDMFSLGPDAPHHMRWRCAKLLNQYKLLYDVSRTRFVNIHNVNRFTSPRLRTAVVNASTGVMHHYKRVNFRCVTSELVSDPYPGLAALERRLQKRVTQMKAYLNGGA